MRIQEHELILILCKAKLEQRKVNVDSYEWLKKMTCREDLTKMVTYVEKTYEMVDQFRDLTSYDLGLYTRALNNLELGVVYFLEKLDDTLVWTAHKRDEVRKLRVLIEKYEERLILLTRRIIVSDSSSC